MDYHVALRLPRRALPGKTGDIFESCGAGNFELGFLSDVGLLGTGIGGFPFWNGEWGRSDQRKVFCAMASGPILASELGVCFANLISSIHMTP